MRIRYIKIIAHVMIPLWKLGQWTWITVLLLNKYGILISKVHNNTKQNKVTRKKEPLSWLTTFYLNLGKHCTRPGYKDKNNNTVK